MFLGRVRGAWSGVDVGVDAGRVVGCLLRRFMGAGCLSLMVLVEGGMGVVVGGACIWAVLGLVVGLELGLLLHRLW